MSDPNIVIMAAGASSRMRRSLEEDLGLERSKSDISPIIPKAMIPVGFGGRPFLDYLLMNVSKAGYTDAVVVVSSSDRLIRGRYPDPSSVGLPEDLKISFAVQEIPEGRDKPAGTADDGI